MANIINRQQTFSANGTVTAAGLHNLIDTALVNSAIIKNQQEITTIGTDDLLLIAPDSVDASLAPRKVTVQNLLEDGLTAGTFVNLNLTGALTYGTATGNRTVSTSATITTGTITNLTAGTTTSTAATITNGTITTALIPVLTAGTTTGTAGIFTSGTIATLNSTTGTIGTLNSTTGTIATLNSTTGTIGNLSTTLAGDFTISQGTGTIGTAKVTPTNLSQPFTSGTAVTSTSGTAIDFTGIPSWVKRITVMFNEVSLSGSSAFLLQAGTSTGIVTTGYSGGGMRYGGSTISAASFTAGVSPNNTTAGATYSGQAAWTLVSGNIWVCSLNLGAAGGESGCISGGSITLSGALDRIRITTVNGTDTFDAGSINIMYEG